MTRVKLAELTSGIGALVLGGGLGALFADWSASSATAIVLVGRGGGPRIRDVGQTPAGGPIPH
jgi:hypothetical protein